MLNPEYIMCSCLSEELNSLISYNLYVPSRGRYGSTKDHLSSHKLNVEASASICSWSMLKMTLKIGSSIHQENQF